MTKPNPKVDGYIRKHKQWHNELTELRRIILDRGLSEEIKWRVPVYTSEGDRNVVFLGAFKESAVLSFVKGALLRDPEKILLKPGENTQSARVIRFTDAAQIIELEPVLKVYIDEAIGVEKAGLKVKFKKPGEHRIPPEFAKKLAELPALKKAFAALTPGRQRAYLMHFSAAKQSKTREARVEKWLPRILKGMGLDD